MNEELKQEAINRLASMYGPGTLNGAATLLGEYIDRATMIEQNRIKGIIIDMAEPYKDSKWLNPIDSEKLMRAIEKGQAV